MKSTFTKLDRIKGDAKNLRVDYIKEMDIRKAGKILKRRSIQVEKMHAIQDQIINFYLPNLYENENHVNYLGEFLQSIPKNKFYSKNIAVV